MTDGAAAQATALTAGRNRRGGSLRGREWSEPLVATFHRQGLLAFGWDAQSDSMLARLLALDIDAVYCDDVGRMLRALRTHARRGDPQRAHRSTRGHNRRVREGAVREEAEGRQRPDPDEGAPDDEVARDEADEA